jgi:hypothetical protein
MRMLAAISWAARFHEQRLFLHFGSSSPASVRPMFW